MTNAIQRLRQVAFTVKDRNNAADKTRVHSFKFVLFTAPAREATNRSPSVDIPQITA